MDSALERLARVSDASWRWHARSGDILRCSGPHHEPLDRVAAASIVEAQTVTLLPARRVAVVSAGGAQVLHVEWRREGENATTELLARRPLDAGDGAALPVAREDRWLRFVAEDPGRSPRSVIVRAEEVAPRIRLGELPLGGEIVGRFVPRRFLPRQVEVRSPAMEELVPVDDARAFARQGLRAGRYELTPVYAGGIRGRSSEAAVTPGASTELMSLVMPDTGALELWAEPRLCGERESSEVVVEKVVEGERSVGLGEVLWRQPLTGGCQWWLEGLGAGRYQARMVANRDGSTVVWADVVIAAGEVASAELTAGAVQVAGRVTVGEDHPLAGAWLRFSQGTREVASQADADGSYRVSLPSAGGYDVMISATRYFPAATEHRRFEAGDNEADFLLRGGAVIVRLSRQDGAAVDEPIQVVVATRDGKRTEGFLLPDESEESLLAGLAYGEYEASAYSNSGWGSARSESFTLDEDEPVAEVELVLDRLVRRVRVVDPSNAPVPGVELRVGMRAMQESQPGLFLLPGVRSGETMRVRPGRGWVPQCRVLPSEGTLDVVLAPGPHTVTVVLPGSAAVPAGTLIGLPGSECDVGLAVQDVEATPVEGGIAVRISNLPSGQFLFLPFGSSTPVPLTVPGPAVRVPPD